jgi:hypothetical protein
MVSVLSLQLRLDRRSEKHRALYAANVCHGLRAEHYPAGSNNGGRQKYAMRGVRNQQSSEGECRYTGHSLSRIRQ